MDSCPQVIEPVGGEMGIYTLTGYFTVGEYLRLLGFQFYYLQHQDDYNYSTS